MPSNSPFIDHHEWWDTRDIAAFLTVPAAIRFQQDHDWAKVRSACHRLAVEAWERIHDLKEQVPLHSDPETWFAQMAVATLPANTDIVSFRKRLYDEYRVEIPLIDWHGNKLMRLSVQEYNSRCDTNELLDVLNHLLA